ncbi:MAG: flagellar protein FlaG [Treponema sp.]|nr:flagellar protein FlaG [Treponema sp.]
MSSVSSVGYSPVPMQLPADLRFPAVRQNDDTATQQKIKHEAITSTAEDLHRMRLVFNRKLQFEVDHNSNQVIVKVIDKETDKVIKELPPEELQRLHKYLKEAIGLLFDEMA